MRYLGFSKYIKMTAGAENVPSQFNRTLG